VTTSTNPATALGTESARILIVDDEEANLMVLRRMLERAGYHNLQTLSDSKLAIERFMSFEPDLVVLDLHMPEPDGFEVMAQLEPLVPPETYVPILVLTADITESTRERALAVGARDFLTKPFRYTELLLRINNLLETRALHSQLHRDKAILEARMRDQQATDQARAERRRAASRRIESVLENDKQGADASGGVSLQMVYQPILDLADGTVIGAEALARFGTEPQRSPAQWFVEAAEVGLGIQLELAALRRAAEGLALLPADAFLSVNASAETIRSPALLEAIDRLPSSRLVIELTEHERVPDYDTLIGPVTELRRRGVRLAVDDAGAGFASLQHILRLCPDLIKLDRTFIDGLAEDPVRRALTTALVSFSTEIGATLVAEGVASSEELVALQELGITVGQGMFLGEPGHLPFDPTTMAHLGGAVSG
jgi:EAL domain-containing protein (putative c-di-GMP-specific phosphodiesterase class I)/AmiR/NasT family two-component response regulator